MRDHLDVEFDRWKWVRSPKGLISGALEGLGESYGINPNWLRAVFILGVLFFGTGLILYLVLAIMMPHQNAVENYDRPQLFGVCYRISKRVLIELPIIRIGMVLGAIVSFGLFIFIYICFSLLFFLQNNDWED